MVQNCTSRAAWALVTGVACWYAVGPMPVTWADSGNPAVTCTQGHVGSIDQDICVGKPGAVAGITPRDLYPGVVPRLRFGVGAGI